MGYEEEASRKLTGLVVNRKTKFKQARTFILVHINFDATEELEGDGEVKPAMTDGMPSAVYRGLDDGNTWLH